MNADDVEEFLTTLHQNLERSALDAYQTGHYVPFVEDGRAGGNDIVKSFAKDIRRSRPGSAYFLTGTRGTGKSTQMRRLQKQLTDDGFVALWLEAEDYLNLQQPVDLVEFLFFLVGGISDAVERDELVDVSAGRGRGWRRLKQWLQGLPDRIALDGAEVNVGFGFKELIFGEIGLQGEIRKDERFVAQLRDYLDGRVNQLIEQANAIVDALIAEVRTNWQAARTEPFKGFVVLIDSLDHARGANFIETRKALVDLFDNRLDSITLNSCRSLFIVPPHLPVEFGSRRVLTNVLVTGSYAAEAGREALSEVVAARMPGHQSTLFFAHPGQLTVMIEQSGGHLRDLLAMVREAGTQADDLPITDDDVSEAIRFVRAGLLPIADDERAALRRVRDEHQLPLASQEGWLTVANLLDRHLILGYQNGELWYGVHPLVADRLDLPS